MRALYLDCFAGISGDMFLSSLLDAGLDSIDLLECLKLLGLDGYKFNIIPTNRHSLTGTRIDIAVYKEQPHRHFSDIAKLVNSSSLPDIIKDNSLRCFKNLAEAEARVHGVPVDKIHFHEVGAVDSILDIVGAATALYLLKPDKIYCSTLPLGGGYIKCEHGTLPVPAPATAELIKGMPVKMGPVDSELVTPTGAALVKTFVDEFKLPQLQVDKIGYGFGSRELPIPNALRSMLGSVDPFSSFSTERITVLECNIDDMNPEIAPYLQELLLEEGALDVYIQSTSMKKGRLGIEIKAICYPEYSEKLIQLLMRESTTLGVRFRTENRLTSQRSIVGVSTPYGEVRVKVGQLDNGVPLQYAPEFEDCRAISRRHNIPLKEVYRISQIAFEQQYKKD